MATTSETQDERRIVCRDEVIRVGAGFVANERSLVRGSLSALATHLGRWDPRDVDIEVGFRRAAIRHPSP
ncbi:hypothetical protein [Mycolicibacterium sp. XJ1819]